jgi:hypothetical protein
LVLERFAVGAPPTNGWTQGRVFCIRVDGGRARRRTTVAAAVAVRCATAVRPWAQSTLLTRRRTRCADATRIRTRKVSCGASSERASSSEERPRRSRSCHGPAARRWALDCSGRVWLRRPVTVRTTVAEADTVRVSQPPPLACQQRPTSSSQCAMAALRRTARPSTHRRSPTGAASVAAAAASPSRPPPPAHHPPTTIPSHRHSPTTDATPLTPHPKMESALPPPRASSVAQTTARGCRERRLPCRCTDGGNARAHGGGGSPLRQCRAPRGPSRR